MTRHTEKARIAQRHLVHALRGRPVAIAVAALLSASGVFAQTLHTFSIPPGPLSTVLSNAAATAGVLLSVDAKLTQDIDSPGVQGRFTVEEGLSRALAGTGLMAVSRPDGGFTLRAIPVARPSSEGFRAAAADAATLDTVTVTANQLGEITEGTGRYAPGTIATATRLVLTPRETPQSISVVTRQEMDDFDLNSIDRVIQHTPGVSTITYDSERTEYFARGFSINEFQYDGIPITRNSRYASGETLSDTVIYDRVEVLKGATGLITGAGTPGATINLVRKKPTRSFQGYVSGSAGSRNNYRTEADVSGALNASGSLRGRAVAAVQDQHSHLDNYQRQTRLFYGTLELDLTPDTLLTVGADLQHNDPQGSSWGGIRLFDSAGNFNTMPRSFNPGARWAHWDQYRKSAFATVEHQFAGGWTGKLQLNHQINGYDTEMGAPNGYMTYPDPLNGSGVTMAGWLGKYVGELRSNALDAYLSGPFSLLGREHELVVGASVSRQKHGGEYAFAPSSYDISVPNYYAWTGDVPKPAWVAAGTQEEVTRQSGLYATGRFNLADDLKLILGSRIANYDYSYTYTNIAQPEERRKRGQIVPYASLVYELGKDWSAYGSFTSIFQPQSYEDVNGRRIDPLEGASYEIGVKGQLFGGKLNTSVAYFQTRQDNYAQRTTGRTPSGGIAYTTADGVLVKGFEAEVSGELSPGWQVHAGYTHKVAKLNGQKTTTIEPEDQLQLSTSYRLRGALHGLTLGASARWQSKSWDDVNHPLDGYVPFTVAGYWLADLSAHYAINKNLTASIHVKNVFDRRYYSIMSIYDVYSWGAPRSMSVRLAYKF